ncbi:c-type cytochrome [Mucilaginibacter xinganensis]|uniref:Photosynthetic reaction center cytochrome c subunit n=1 Tax=Mucilaginibacter xinganensis TaxID=1234841 RepID=A0A223NZH7_9SPHI|nr:c-type cytochrome [Mucilaginibacter xinganensis]ASU35262.1 c-type cytochrome [Mucilaginibacter xinganensis]
MLINKKIWVTLGLASVVSIVALTSMAPDKEFKNLKVLPKHITDRQLDQVMDEWSHSLGVHCNFCHVRNEAEKKMDFASDAKPEKEMARKMYKMMNKINQKYFEAKKDSLGMVMKSGVNCNTCHHGESHPEVKVPERRRGPGGPPPGGAPSPGGIGVPQGDHKQ